MIDEMDAYIVRDVLSDDLIFVTPKDVLNDDHEVLDENYVGWNRREFSALKDVYFDH